MRELATAEGVRTGALFGILRDIRGFHERFQTQNLVFTFDVGANRRYRISSDYKSTRRKQREASPPEEQEAYKELNKQIDKLRTDYLPRCGYTNVFWQDGFEADDVLAAISSSIIPSVTGVIVSSDEDMWQLLRPNISVFNPSTEFTMTLDKFHKKYGIDAAMWADVKALAGCKSDDVPGVAGVGNITAAKFLRGALAPGKKYEAIIKANNTWRENLKLVTLPLPGTATPKLVINQVTPAKWDVVARELGMSTLLNTSRASAPRERV